VRAAGRIAVPLPFPFSSYEMLIAASKRESISKTLIISTWFGLVTGIIEGFT
jgi:hypothetical protein